MATITILYEDNHLLVVDKPAGMLSQKDHTGEDSVIEHAKAYLKEKYNKPGNVFCAPVHRLDRQVSGIIIMARTSKAAGRMHGQFYERSVEKYYVAVAHTAMGQGDDASHASDWIGLKQKLSRQHDTTLVVADSAPGDDAELAYRVIGRDGVFTFLLVKLITGKKHQIRAQLASIGMPIVGDIKYGSQMTLAGGAICLHACYVRFTHPTQKTEVRVLADIPARFFDCGDFSRDILSHV
ncbi:MAG TPA: RluA family pseudouridine synthase [Spirochaetota bacterium]|mgnify:CR=1 FL=1|nr:RluA family pseudouridine synthase [Spirochaetota bacterium]HPU90383.1 RluA family pseudouridine synthase [Spirochaetota bacterium]